MSLTSCFDKAGRCLLLIAVVICANGCAVKGRSGATGPPAVAAPLRHAIGSVAILPVENLSSQPVPLKEIREFLIRRIALSGGSEVLGNVELEELMARHRVRYTGGIDSLTAEAFKTEAGVDAVLITSVEQYSETYPPRIGVVSRLVSTSAPPVILWIESIGLAGDDSPGLLGLGLITDPGVLQTKALRILTDSLVRYLFNGLERSEPTSEKRFQPKILFQAAPLPAGKNLRMAVTPFFNSSNRKFAGEIMVLHLVKELASREGFVVIEPGVMRQKLLNFRVIMNNGISLADEDLIAQSLDADYIVTGEVMDYQDDESTRGQPKVDFFTMLIDRNTKKVVWASESYNKGNDGVFFFDYRRINTASSLATEMTQSLITEMIRQ